MGHGEGDEFAFRARDDNKAADLVERDAEGDRATVRSRLDHGADASRELYESKIACGTSPIGNDHRSVTCGHCFRRQQAGQVSG
jgi:hypothetical protein